MPSCAGLNRKRGSAEAWAKCPRKAARGDHYCTKHRDALDGAFLGLMSRERSLNAIQKIIYEEAEARRKAAGREVARSKQARRREKKLLAQEALFEKESRRGATKSVAVPVNPAGHEKIAAPAALAAAVAESR
jgi:hypothetical protein